VFERVWDVPSIGELDWGLGEEPVQSDNVQDSSEGGSGTSTAEMELEERVQPLPCKLVPAELLMLPKEVEGVPVFHEGNEEVVFIAHLLARVMRCACRQKLHSGLFRCRKYKEFRRQVPTKAWRLKMNGSPEYAQYKQGYSLARFKEPSAAVTLEGLKQWVDIGALASFVEREWAKCKQQGCVKANCTCQ